MVVFVADDVVQKCATVQAKEADELHDGEAAAGFLLAGLGPAFLVLRRVGHGKAGAVEQSHAPFTPEFLGEDASGERIGNSPQELLDDVYRKSFAGLAIRAGVGAHACFVIGPVPPRLRFAHSLATSRHRREHLKQEDPKRGVHAKNTFPAVGSLRSWGEHPCRDSRTEHTLEFTEMLNHRGRFAMGSATEKKGSKRSEKWRSHTHVRPSIRLDLPSLHFFLQIPHFHPSTLLS